MTMNYSPISIFFLVFFLAVIIETCFAIDINSASNIILEYTQQSNASLLWGPYRSNLYFGVRPKGIPNSFMSGLIWYNIDDYTGLKKIRHACDQGDDMQGYGWEQYDPRSGGTQVFHDQKEQNVDLTTQFVKSKDGKSWALRVKGVPSNDNPNALTTIAFYAGIEGLRKGNKFELKDHSQYHSKKGIKGNIAFKGFSPELGEFEVTVTENGGPEALPNGYALKSFHPAAKAIETENSRHVSLHVPDDNMWKARDIYVTIIQDRTQKLYDKYKDDSTLPPWVACVLDPELHNMKGNLHFVQRTFRGEFEFDVLFNDVKSSEKIDSQNFAEYLETSLKTFEKKFNNAFTFQPPYSDQNKKNIRYKEFAQELFSNLIGGVGYFQGTSIVDRSYSSAYDEEDEGFWEDAEKQLKEGSENAAEEGPYELLTAVPSRPFFPRGFYWDEGFHLIPILEYDADLALEILKSWFSLIDDDGWIAREQILGLEARSKVPKEFQTQYPHYANPPTLLLLLSNILNKFQESQDELPESVFQNPLLHNHNRRPRSHTHHLHREKSDEKKRHKFDEVNPNENIDMVEGLGSGSLHISDTITNEDIVAGTAHWRSGELLKVYLKNIYPELKLHYDWFRRTQRGDIKEWGREAYSTREGYRWRGRTPNHCLTSGLDDYPRANTPHTGELHVDLISWIGMMTRSMKQLAEFLGNEEDASDYAEIETAIVHNINDLHWDPKSQTYCDATIDDFEENAFVCHKGYVSLFPFLLRLIPANSENDDKILAILDMIHDPNELWTKFGVRSLSISDEYYGKGENYWRGPIWVNINYMILDSLIYYHDTSSSEKIREKCSLIFKELRLNIVENVYGEWERTGYAWEQYDPVSGRGKGVKHFLGWTSLVVMIMSMPDSLEQI